MAEHQDPIIVEVRRGNAIESTHQVHAVVATVDGPTRVWGDGDRLTMPRSSIKSIQVLPMLALGAADAYDVTEDEIALASSSHNAESAHTAAVEAWLTRIGLSPDSLECGPSDPIHTESARDLYRGGTEPGRIHNCCSGKHAGFLTLAQHLADQDGYALPGYLSPTHAVQQRVREAQEMLTGVDLRSQTPVIDGCGIPVFEFPLGSLALAMARLVTPESLPEPLRDPAARVVAALPSRSFLVSGTGRADYVLTEAATEPLIIKGGAEGVSMGVLVERGVGFALKCEDGNGRGVEEAVAGVLHHLGALPQRVSLNTPLRNKAGTDVGSVTVTL